MCVSFVLLLYAQTHVYGGGLFHFVHLHHGTSVEPQSQSTMTDSCSLPFNPYLVARTLSYRKTAPSNTLAPSALKRLALSLKQQRITYQSSGEQYSVGLWLIPDLVGVKIILVGHTRLV